MLIYVILIFIGIVIGVAAGMYFIWKIADTALKNQDRQTLRATSYYEVSNQWVKNLHDGHKVDEFFKENGYQHIAIYGYADLGKRLHEELCQQENSEVHVDYIIDQNAGRVASELKVYAPSEPLPTVDVIIVTPVHIYPQILRLLEKNNECKIISLEEVIYNT